MTSESSVGNMQYPNIKVGLLISMQSESVLTIDMLNNEETPRTPTTNNINIADAYDWQHRANVAEQELSIERTKLQREKRRSCRLETQINEYIEALTRSTQGCVQARSQCQYLSTSNAVLFQEVGKLRLVVQTLEGVIHLLYTTDGSVTASAAPKRRDRR
jgi:hypothetical protein